jgi:hypothetical protein
MSHEEEDQEALAGKLTHRLRYIYSNMQSRGERRSEEVRKWSTLNCCATTLCIPAAGIGKDFCLDALTAEQRRQPTRILIREATITW